MLLSHCMVAPAQETLSYRNAALEDFLLRQQTEMQQRRSAVWKRFKPERNTQDKAGQCSINVHSLATVLASAPSVSDASAWQPLSVFSQSLLNVCRQEPSHISIVIASAAKRPPGHSSAYAGGVARTAEETQHRQATSGLTITRGVWWRTSPGWQGSKRWCSPSERTPQRA